MAYPLKKFRYNDFINWSNNIYFSNADRVIYTPEITDVPNSTWNINIYDKNSDLLIDTGVNITSGSRVFYRRKPNVVQQNFQVLDCGYDTNVLKFWVRATPEEFHEQPINTPMSWLIGQSTGLLAGTYYVDNAAYGRYYNLTPGSYRGLIISEFFEAIVTGSCYELIVYNKENEITHNQIYHPQDYGLRAISVKMDSAAEVPTSPLITNIGPIDYQRIDMSWQSITNNEHTYLIQKSLNNINWNNLIFLDSSTTYYSDTGLTTETDYYYTIRGINGVGTSSIGNIYKVTTTQLPLPETPDNLAVYATSYQQIYLTWNDKSTPADILIERASSISPSSFAPDTPYVQIVSLPVDSVNYSDLGLTANTRYFYRIRAANLYGTSSYSNIAFVTTLNLPIPDPPKALTATPISSTQINLSWTDSNNNETGYKIEISLDNSTWIEIVNLAANSTSYNSIGLNPNTLYYYRAYSYNDFGNSSYATKSATTLP